MTTPFRLIRSTGAPRSKKNVRPDSRRPQQAHLSMEWLEDRAVPATITVTSLLDVTNPLDNLTTLREAIEASNKTTEADTIKFAAGLAGTINLTAAGTDDDDNKSGDLDVRGSITIEGPGAKVITINQTAGDRVFDILGGKGTTVNVSGLSLTGGNVQGDGGGVRNMSGADLNLTGMEIVGNTAAGTGAGGGVATGTGTLSIASSTLADNTASKGGGLQVFSGQADINTTTVSGNTATNSGGGVNVDSTSGTGVSMRNSTVTNNTAPATQGAGINVAGGSVTLTSTAVTGNIGNDLTGTVTIGGRTNMSSNPSALVPGSVLSTGIGTPVGVASLFNPGFGPLAADRGLTRANPPGPESLPATSANAQARSASDARSTARIVRTPAEVAQSESRWVPDQNQLPPQTTPSLSPTTPVTPTAAVDTAAELPGGRPEPSAGANAEALVATVMNLIARDGAQTGVSVIAFLDVDGDGVKEVVLALSGAGGEQAIVVLNGTTGAPVFFVPGSGAGR